MNAALMGLKPETRSHSLQTGGLVVYSTRQTLECFRRNFQADNADVWLSLERHRPKKRSLKA